MVPAKKKAAASDEGSGTFDFSKKPKSQTSSNVFGKYNSLHFECFAANTEHV